MNEVVMALRAAAAVLSATVFDWERPGGGSRTVKVGDTTIVYGFDGKSAHIASVRTPQTKRGKGSGRKALETFLAEADALGIPVKLESSPLDKKTRGDKLSEFYRRLGFESTGRRINPAGDLEMVRQPKVQAAGSIRDWAEGVERELGLKAFDVYDQGRDWKLNVLEVAKEDRKRGLGTKAMERLCVHADENGKRLLLTPALPDDRKGTTSRARLVRFYKRFGFVENKGLFISIRDEAKAVLKGLMDGGDEMALS